MQRRSVKVEWVLHMALHNLVQCNNAGCHMWGDSMDRQATFVSRHVTLETPGLRKQKGDYFKNNVQSTDLSSPKSSRAICPPP